MTSTAGPMGLDLEQQLRSLAEEALAASARSGVYAIAGWTAYVDNVRAAVNEIRALESADLVFLQGVRLREIADAVTEVNGQTLSHQAVAEWVSRHGPKNYAVVVKDGDRYSITFVPVLGTVQTRRELLAMQRAGGRIAPAKWRIDETCTLTAKQLWDRIGG